MQFKLCNSQFLYLNANNDTNTDANWLMPRFPNGFQKFKQLCRKNNILSCYLRHQCQEVKNVIFAVNLFTFNEAKSELLLIPVHDGITPESSNFS